MIGQTIAHYTITEKIGEGGMGEVYRATDGVLKRDVALKFRPESMAQDETARRRFLREARSAAALDHPFICQIHEIGEVDGVDFIAMEYVAGQTLKEKLVEGLLPIAECLRIASEIAEALDKAQEKGIVHRDLKPANIMLTSGGHVKLMDFGLAKRATGAQEDTQQVDMTKLTREGSTLGTVPYMSPEQLKGEDVDTRSDIFSFGIILYERLAGVHPFIKPDAMATASSILNEEPPPLALHREGISAVVQYMLRKMLAKESEKRYQSVRDIHTDLVALQDPGPAAVLAGQIQGPAPQSKLPWVATFLLGVIVATGASFWLRVQPVPSQPVRRFPLTLPATQVLPAASGSLLAISPNGQMLIYGGFEDGVTRLYRRDLDQLETMPIPGTEGARPSDPFFSHDGKLLAFDETGDNTLMRVALTGGRPVGIGQLPTRLRGGSWTSDDTIVAAVRNAGLVRVPAGGGDPVTIAEPDDRREYWYPQFLPGNQAVLFTASFNQPDAGDVMLLDLESSEKSTLVRNAVAGQYVPSGHLVFVRGGNIWATRFDLESLEVVGDPVVIEQGVRVEVGGAIQMAVAADGTLIYIPGQQAAVENNTLGLVDRNGEVERLNVPPGRYLAPHLSPDGSKLAVQTTEGGLRSHRGDIWIYEMSGNTQIRRLTQGGTNIRPIWTSGGDRVTFASVRDGAQGIFWQPADGSGGAERLTTADDGAEHWPGSWSPDGRTLAFSAGPLGTSADRDLWILSPEGANAPELFYDSPGMTSHPKFSPDGHWLAYWSNESGSNEVWVQPFPASPGVKHRITQNTGMHPLWSRDGTELFYRRSRILNRVGIESEPSFAVTLERRVPIDDFIVTGGYRSFDIAPDGERFVMVFPAAESNSGEAARDEIIIIWNWFEELKRLLPTDN